MSCSCVGTTTGGFDCVGTTTDEFDGLAGCDVEFSLVEEELFAEDRDSEDLRDSRTARNLSTSDEAGEVLGEGDASGSTLLLRRRYSPEERGDDSSGVSRLGDSSVETR